MIFFVCKQRVLINAIVIRYLESIIVKISFFWLFSVTGQTDLSLTLPTTPKIGFLTSRPIYLLFVVP